MSKNPHDIVFRPVITEHASELQALDPPQFIFQVDPRANKFEIRWAIQQIFEVEVTNVNTINRRGKKKRLRARMGKRADTKRAIVTLKPGQTIELY